MKLWFSYPNRNMNIKLTRFYQTTTNVACIYKTKVQLKLKVSWGTRHIIITHKNYVNTASSSEKEQPDGLPEI